MKLRTKAHKIKDNLYIIELKDDIFTRLIVTHPDYELSFELLSIYNDDLKLENSIDLKEYIKNVNYENLINYLIDINSEGEDYLYHDEIEMNPLVDKENNDE